MKFTTKPLPFIFLLIFILAFSAQVIPHIFHDSPTVDEPSELANGYSYWKGDVVTNGEHPVLSKMLQALPLRLQKLADNIPPSIPNQLRGRYFLFHLNKDHFEWMLDCGRWVTWLFGLGIGLLLFFQTRNDNFIVVLTTLGLWAFNPTILAHSALSTEDIPVTFFFLASILAFQKHLEKPGYAWSLLTGTLTASAVCSKFSALALLPLFAFFEYFHYKNF